MPSLNIRFLHALCNDVDAVRAFYTDRLGMDEGTYRNDAEWGWVVYRSEGLQLMFHRWTGPSPAPIAAGWSWQPGDGQGDAPTMSFGLQIPADGYAAVVARVAAAGDPAMTAVPTWRQGSYWGWTVKDPMGHTVELYCTPGARPEGEEPVWTGQVQ